ncbi:MAG TPA: protein kinase [Vicinamibacterales bacterium]
MPHAIEPGSTVAHYTIIGPLGAGGMGEVYKAHDTVLGRTIALKVLPPHLVRNDERTRRFIQEARAASSLNHPHIVTIHEIGHAPLTGPDGAAQEGADPIHYIAMELVEGVTLKARIHNEQTPLRVLLTHIAQAAEGLAKAHAAGIVHRDLKPENIMISADGFAKVLDFGLAKLTATPEASDATRTMPAREDTRDGVILGTVGYMSPEQVQGKTADHRSDIFSLGAILYEAATRRRPFVADSDVEVMHRILHDKPEPIADINPAVPAELRRTIRRCLAKEPDRRFQSMKDVAIELAEIVEEFEQLSLASSSSASASSGGIAPLPRGMSGRAKGAIAAAALVAIAALAAGVYQWQQARDGNAGPVAFETMTIRPLTSSGRVLRAAISPDGRYVAYVPRSEDGKLSIWMRQVATGSDVQILPDQTQQIRGLTFSPDGSYVYYTSVEETRALLAFSWLYAIPALGGAPRKVVYDIDTNPTFSPDGTRLAFGRGLPAERKNDVVIVNVDGSGERTVASFPRYIDVDHPMWSPDGTKIVAPVIEMNPAWDAVPIEIDVASGQTRRVGNTRRFALRDLAFLPDSSALLMTAADADTGRDQIWLQPYPDGAPVRITNDLSSYESISLTRDGSQIAAVKAENRTSLFLTGLDAGAAEPVTPQGVTRIDRIDVARSGAMVLNYIKDDAMVVAVVDTPGAAPRVLTRTRENFEPSISDDGRTIVFSTEGTDAPPRIYAINADGSNLRPVTKGEGEQRPTLSGDGRTLAYTTSRGSELWVQPLEGGTPRKITDRSWNFARLSPDGQHLLYFEWQSAGQTDLRLKLVPVAGGPAVVNVPWGTGIDFRWHPDGKRLTYRRTVAGVTNLYAVGLDQRPPVRITNFTEGMFSAYDWTADGRLVFVRTDSTSDVVLISNWLRKR